MNEKILKIPYEAVRNDWDLLQKFLELKGNPRHIIVGDVNLSKKKGIFDLGNLVGVEGYLKLNWSSVESLGELEFVDGDLIFWNCENIKTLGKLKKVGEDLVIISTNIPPSEIDKVEVIGDIYR
jgi:fructose-1,6-bisphosphatase